MNSTAGSTKRFILCFIQLVVLTSLSSGASGLDLNQTVDFNIPKQKLDSALVQFSEQAKIQITSSSDQVKDFSTDGIVGRYKVSMALKALLQRSGLSYKPIGQSAISIGKFSAGSEQSTTQDATTGGGKTTSRDFRVAQVDQGTVGPQAVGDDQNSDRKKKKEDGLSEIVVTGSRIPLPAQEGSQEVRVYSAQQIAQSGQTTLADFLNTLPEVSVSNIDSPIGANYADQTTVQLHGLPQGTTLVLLNGRRVEINNYGFFDLNNIPVSAVERIEVLPVGSAAIYGADSLAGAVNVILKKNFQGFESDFKYGYADGTNEDDATAAWGIAGDRGSLSLIGSYQRRGELIGTQRAATADPNAVQTLFGFDDSCQPGNVYSLNGGNLPGLSSPEAGIPNGIVGKPSVGAFQATAGTVNRCGNTAQSDIIPQIEREGLLVSGDLQISDHLTIFSEILASHESVDSRVSDLITLYNTFGSTLPATNAFNPFGQAVGISYSYPGIAFKYDRTTDFERPLIGARGSIYGDWKFELVAFLSSDQSHVSQNDNYSQAAFNAALASSNPETALNPFAAGAPGSPQLLASLFNVPPTVLVFNSRTVSTEGIVRGPLFTLPSGAVEAAFGFETDQSEIHTAQPDAYVASPPVTNRRSASSVFGEARAPLWQNSAPQPRDILAINVAGRFDHTNDYGNKSTGQGGIEWRPTSTLLFRAGYATSYEAPQLTQIDGAPATYITTGYVDPFRNNEGVANIQVTQGPNPNLKPETGSSKQFGVVYSSPSAGALHASLTYWAINISNYITQPAIQDLIDYPSLFPGTVTRGPSSGGLPGPILSVQDIYANFGDIDVAGWDFDSRYTISTPIGDWTPSVSATQTNKYNVALSPSLPSMSYVSQAGLNGYAPRWKGNLSLGWKSGVYSASLLGRYTGRYRDYQAFVPSTYELGNFWLLDANLHIALGEYLGKDVRWLAGAFVEVGGVNILNRLPQYSANFTGFDYTQGDIRGRFLYARVGVKL
jgi:iron complex outermembrane recepter protein